MKSTITLVVSGLDKNDPQLEDKLYQHCNAALIHYRGDDVSLTFDRETASLTDAIASTIHGIESAINRAKVVAVVSHIT